MYINYTNKNNKNHYSGETIEERSVLNLIGILCSSIFQDFELKQKLFLLQPTEHKASFDFVLEFNSVVRTAIIPRIFSWYKAMVKYFKFSTESCQCFHVYIIRFFIQRNINLVVVYIWIIYLLVVIVKIFNRMVFRISSS